MTRAKWGTIGRKWSKEFRNSGQNKISDSGKM